MSSLSGSAGLGSLLDSAVKTAVSHLASSKPIEDHQVISLYIK